MSKMIEILALPVLRSHLYYHPLSVDGVTIGAPFLGDLFESRRERVIHCLLLCDTRFNSFIVQPSSEVLPDRPTGRRFHKGDGR